jgi:ABC-type cobalamin/Fe3+-siderophores transport system ATPase subunit
MEKDAIVVSGLNYGFGGDSKVLQNLNLTLEKGSRCLLIGANGAGKSTLLRVLAGKHLVKGNVLVCGKNAFTDGTVGITYLGSEWALNPVVRGDVPVARLLKVYCFILISRHWERKDTPKGFLNCWIFWMWIRIGQCMLFQMDNVGVFRSFWDY